MSYLISPMCPVKFSDAINCHFRRKNQTGSCLYLSLGPSALEVKLARNLPIRSFQFKCQIVKLGIYCLYTSTKWTKTSCFLQGYSQYFREPIRITRGNLKVSQLVKLRMGAVSLLSFTLTYSSLWTEDNVFFPKRPRLSDILHFS